MIQEMPGAPLIAIVDDDDSLRNSLENLIRSFGFRAHGFSSAEAFLSWTPARDTACLILDVRMPGMNGLDLQRQMTTRRWRVPGKRWRSNRWVSWVKSIAGVGG